MVGPGEPVTVTVTAERFGSIRHTYVLCRQDRGIRPILQERFVTEIDAISAIPTHVVELESSHSPFLSQPVIVAEVIERASTACATGHPSTSDSSSISSGQPEVGPARRT